MRKLADKETVIFHCALSQVRGPKAARRYLEERNRMLGPEIAGKGEVGEAMKKSKVESGGADARKDGEWVDEAGQSEKPKIAQKVLVLERGFEGWQEVYGKDERLTENYSEELWANGGY